jgi:N-acyl-D-amino-acid deacylase
LAFPADETEVNDVLDIIVRGGDVYDGSGRGPARLDVGINGDKIVSVGDLSHQEAKKVIDATGKIVAPGFIDAHSHSDLRLLYGEPPLVKISQGVTTEILGQDGLSVAPIVEKDIPLYRKMLAGLLGDPDLNWDWRSVSDYLGRLDKHGMPLNAGYLIPHGPIRTEVMGMDDREATRAELDAMHPVLEKAIKQGGCGFSTGLIYPPCSYASTAELIDLCKVAAKNDVAFIVHMRNEGYMIMDSVDEMLTVAKESGVHLHISHLKVFGQSVWGKTGEILDKLARAREQGARITADQYPYFAGCTVLTAVLPTWTLAGGTEALLARLQDKTVRARLKEEFKLPESVWDNRATSVGWENVVVSWVKSEKNKRFEGKNIVEIAEMRGQEPDDAVCDLLVEENLAVTQITFYGTEDTIKPIMVDPWVMFCTDGIYGGKPHPRLYGSFPRILGRYVRDSGWLSMGEAIRKMTSLPAETFRLPGRGSVKEGFAADVTVFDPATIIDNATYDAPETLAAGVSCVIVNGTPVLENAKYSGKNPGRTLRP